MNVSSSALRMAQRFRGFLPVIVDVETGGFDSERHALLEIAAVTVRMDEDGWLHPDPAVSTHVEAFPGSLLDPRSLEVTGIDPTHPLRGITLHLKAPEPHFLGGSTAFEVQLSATGTRRGTALRCLCTAMARPATTGH